MHTMIFSHPENMQFVCIWRRFTGEKTNQYNLYSVAVSAYDEPPVETEMVWPPIIPDKWSSSRKASLSEL